MIGMPLFKIVAVGDGAVGKTCLLVTYAKNEFPTKYVPTTFDNYDKVTEYKGKVVRLAIWDTAGQEDLEKLRRCSYPDTHIFLICFNIMSPTSLQNIQTYWKKDLDTHCPEALRVLVGTKHDLRGDPVEMRKMLVEEGTDKCVARKDAEKVAKECGCLTYVETSAKTLFNINELFECVMEYCLQKYWNPMENLGKGGGGISGGICTSKKAKKKKKKKGGLLSSGMTEEEVEQDLFSFSSFASKK